MPSLPMSSRWWLWLLLLALGAAFFVNLNAWGVLESSEARYAEIGREMLVGQDWLHPRLLGIQHFHKPPVTYWLTAAGLGLFGSSAGAVRVLPVLAVLVQVVLMYGLGLLLFAGDRRRAIAAAVVYGTLPVVLISALNVTTDAYLATLELLSAYAFVRYHYTPAGKPAAAWLYLGWIALGVGFLTKGPVAVVLPLMAVISLHTSREAPRRPWSAHHLLAFALFMLAGLSWYLLLWLDDPKFLRYFLFEHTVQRFANAATFNRAKPWWFYVVLAPLGSLPWSVVLIAEVVRNGWRGLGARWRQVLLWWVLVPLVFFSLSKSKLLLYVLPIFPGVALLTVELLGRRTDAVLFRWYVGFMSLFGLLLGAMCLLPIFGPGFGLTISPITAMWPAASVVVLLLTHLFWDEVRIAPKLLVLTVVFTMGLLVSAKAFLGQVEAQANGSRPVAERLKQLKLTQRPVLVYNELLPSLAFEQHKLPVSLYDGNHSLQRETQFERDEQWRRYLINLQDAADTVALGAWLRQRPVVLAKKELPAERQYLVKGLSKQEHVGPWTIYY
ncbi:glycosyltransferase family 39 protein [Hymenobacter latericus]|uniref:glycosyltransferase family 39 protein n=1 Tax=Hymenobacter sp. YIM 151858-1 TaxID=2987688 RepID=UPI002225DD02|nr:glycosyltransferase family 39 protein [Hymenobacter sp. YIM 151858-1]UYZ60783.1 glycosyltransferase family 39 protein [Hymenobacter sp. YIM 151858-1]